MRYGKLIKNLGSFIKHLTLHVVYTDLVQFPFQKISMLGGSGGLLV